MIVDPGRPPAEPTRFLALPEAPRGVIAVRPASDDPPVDHAGHTRSSPGRPAPGSQAEPEPPASGDRPKSECPSPDWTDPRLPPSGDRGGQARPSAGYQPGSERATSERPGAEQARPDGPASRPGLTPGAAIGASPYRGQFPLRFGPRPTHLRPVINATGILLHDGLGRAPLSAAARTAIDAASTSCDVELDLATGRRGRRGGAALTALAASVPAARAVHIVNNNAGALMLAAMALADGREIVISRGEFIETADGFRLPELLTSAGARLREVGTTNRTTLGDYADAIGPRTGFVLRLHPPSYQVVGLTATPTLTDLAELCARRGVVLVGDPGSGLLAPDPALPGAPDASTWLRDGASLVMTSGDKLLGGPQCGLILGRADLVDRMRRHPLARALRVDKLTLAALAATLSSDDNPVRRSLRTDATELRGRAERLASWLRASGVPASAVSSRAVVSSDGVDDSVRPLASPRRGGVAGGPDVRPDSAWPGAGGFAGHGPTTGHDRTTGAYVWERGLSSAAVALDATLAGLLRQGRPPVLGRVEQGCCLLDLRSVPPELDPVLAATVLAAATGNGAVNDPPAAPHGEAGTEAGAWAHAPSWARRTDRVPTSGWPPSDSRTPTNGRTPTNSWTPTNGRAPVPGGTDADEVTLQ